MGPSSCEEAENTADHEYTGDLTWSVAQYIHNKA